MKGSKKVIDALNEVLAGELVGINQYFLHAKMCQNWGFERLAEHDHKESIGEMKHAERADRAHPLPRGAPEPAEARQAPDRRDRARAARRTTWRSRREAVAKLNKAHRAVRRRGRQHLARAAGGHARERGGARRLARDAARTDRDGRREAVPVRADAQVIVAAREAWRLPGPIDDLRFSPPSGSTPSSLSDRPSWCPCRASSWPDTPRRSPRRTAPPARPGAPRPPTARSADR